MKRLTISTLSLDNVLNRLQNGETIYFDNKISYRMVNKILCRFEYDKCTHINENLSFEDGNHYYFLEKEPIKFEVGNYYKTVMGNKVFCYNIKDNDPFPYKMVTMNKQDGFSVNAKGNRYTDLSTGSDIVDYWKD